jgi:MFS family permease
VAFFLASASMRYLGTGIVLTYFTLFAITDLGIAIGDAALAIAAGGVLQLLIAVPIGRLADSMDRRRLLLYSTLLVAFVQVCTGFAVWNLTGLYVVLLVGAVGRTVDMIASGPLFMDLMPPERRGELTGVNMVLQNVFRAGGALIGGAIFAWTDGYRLCYAVAPVCMVLSFLLLAKVRVAPSTR